MVDYDIILVIEVAIHYILLPIMIAIDRKMHICHEWIRLTLHVYSKLILVKFLN